MTKHEVIDKVVAQYSRGLITPKELHDQILSIYAVNDLVDCSCLQCL